MKINKSLWLLIAFFMAFIAVMLLYRNSEEAIVTVDGFSQLIALILSGGAIFIAGKNYPYKESTV